MGDNGVQFNLGKKHVGLDVSGQSGYSRIIQEVQFGLIVWNSVIPHCMPSYAM